METIGLIVYGGVMFVLGMYVTTQLRDRITKQIITKPQEEEPYTVPASDWDDEEED